LFLFKQIEFKRINNIASLCEYCKNERLINEVKRVNNKDCCFCSEGCKILFHYELEKNWGKHCQSCTFCHSISKTVVTAHDDEKEFCSAECSFGYTSLQSHVNIFFSDYFLERSPFPTFRLFSFWICGIRGLFAGHHQHHPTVQLCAPRCSARYVITHILP
uniref:Uncharacterized protein n=1 Tax=Oryzias melastigma TaxID=30732 RepID=A0A3B3DSK5_ORYME